MVAASPLLYGYWNNPPYWAGLEYVYGHFWAGGASKADVHSVYPMFAFDANQTWRTQVLGWAAWRDFYDTTPNDRLYGAGVIEYYLMRKGLAQPSCRCALGGGLYFTGGRGQLSTILSSQPASSGRSGRINGFIDISGFYILRDYRFDPAFYSDISRTDNEKDLYVSLRGVLSDNMQIVFLFQRVWNDSNISLVEHRRSL